MPADDERREVARRLREFAETDVGRVNHGFWNRLADLIEPEPERICHPIFGECDLCKWPLRDGALYCAHCGARIEVVDDAD